jgi:phenylacetate-CoA ligase
MNPYTTLGSRLLFPLHERLKGHDTVSILRDLEQSQWWSPEQLLQAQARQLEAFLRSIVAHVPYFRERIDPKTIAPATTPSALLRALPITDKSEMRKYPDAWRADNAGPLAHLSTSGSSGEPLHFLLGKHRVSFDIAAKWRATRWWGVDIGDREMVLWGSSIEVGAQDRLRTLRDRLFRSKLVSARNLDAQRITEILEEMLRFRPKMLFGYPSAVARIAAHARKHGVDMRSAGVQVAFCTSEVLQSEWRRLIADTFGCGVANEYGARDAGFIARECPHGGLHITSEELIVEIVDEHGQHVEPGEEGDILVTNLAGPEFPFIRYRTGDRGSYSTTPCPCGRGLPVLAAVAGRSNDGLVSTTGAWIHGSAINHLMRDITGLSTYRITQDTPGALDIQLVLEVPLREQDKHHLIERAWQIMGATARIDVRQVDVIPSLANGKFRHIICNVTPQ